MAIPLLSTIPDFDNPMHPVNIQNPFPLYSWLRDNSPVHWSKQINSWLITRFADVRAAFGDTDRFSSQGGVPLLPIADTLPPEARTDFLVGYRFVYQQIQASDGLLHTTQRSLITKAFSARVLESIRVRVQHRVDTLIDEMERQQTCDLVRDFAYPLPSLVVLDLLGVAEEHYATLRHSATAFTQFVSAALTRDAEALRQVAAAFQQTEALLRQLIEQRRGKPRQDLISALVSVREEKAQLSEDQIVVLCNFLLFAGHETTANLVAGSVLHLLSDRQHWESLIYSPTVLANAIEELLRFVSPVLSLSRVTTKDLELHGTFIKKGERVSLMIGAANHDPAQFDDAESLNLRRPRVQSLAFGHGVHFCVGALLARMEAEIAFRSLAKRLPKMQLVPGQAEYQPIFFLRALKALPIRTA